MFAAPGTLPALAETGSSSGREPREGIYVLNSPLHHAQPWVSHTAQLRLSFFTCQSIVPPCKAQIL